MSDAVTMRKSNRAALLCGIGAIVLGLGSALAARYDALPKLLGFVGVALGLLIALAAVVLGVIGLFRARKSGSGLRAATIGLLLGGAYLAIVLALIIPGLGNPQIHDVTTDLASPPEFRALTLPADNLRGVGTVEKWRELHAKSYGDIQPIALPMTPAEVIARATGLAQERGWTIALANPGSGRLEATDSVSLIGFKDDIVIVATPTTGGSLVNARSVSRVGSGDMGVNAKRLREFLKALAG